MAREKEEKFAGIRRLSDRKKALNDRISKNSKELLELGNNTKPIKDKIAKRESEVCNAPEVCHLRLPTDPNQLHFLRIKERENEKAYYGRRR